MAKLSCRLLCHSISTHVQQVYTGFQMLHERGLITLSQCVLKENSSDLKRPQHLRDARQAHVRVVVNGALKLYYDVHDSYEIDHACLDDTDFYFKRSFSSLPPEWADHRQKLHPLGLNYPVFPNRVDLFALSRSIFLRANLRQTAREIARSLNVNPFYFVPRVRLMESLPDYKAEPKILFAVRAWDPYNDPDRSQDKIEEIMSLNAMRASCIRLLRNEFGGLFCGGFQHTTFAIKHYKDELMPDNALSSKRNYIAQLRSHPICIATTGLHGSIGWKFAEYIAFSKAVLSEKLNYEVPGDLEEGRHFLGMASPEDCVAGARRLVVDRELRHYLMTNNARYYQSYVRPDSLILNTLLTALSQKG
jgi:hypothetical protein